MRPRLLTATIAMGGLLLVSKSAGLVLAYLPGGWAIQAAVMPVAAATESSHAEAPSHDAKASPPHDGKTAQPAGDQAAKPAPAAAKPSDPPQPAISPEELKLLQDLRARRKEAEARERGLIERESVINAAEQRIVARAAELAALQSRLEQLEKSRAQRDDANWAGLVKLYETMKPRDAATIFNDMDMPVLLELADRMKETKAASILAAMLPDRARLLTAQLAAKRSHTTTLPPQAGLSSEGSAHS